ncbi:MAG: GNAT family N-acetyltransferase [Candidatus Avilachnospira sp.]|jgi:predicted acetyltransferase
MYKSLPILKITEHPELTAAAAAWFSSKWEIPEEEYLKSMKAAQANYSKSLSKDISVSQWYVITDGDKIVAGAGIIENDFHERKDLRPNLCALYVEPEYRCLGIAGAILEFICRDMKEQGIETLYLITNHSSFYERYGWKYLCMVKPDDEDELMRMYIHESRSPLM